MAEFSNQPQSSFHPFVIWVPVSDWENICQICKQSNPHLSLLYSVYKQMEKREQSRNSYKASRCANIFCQIYKQQTVILFFNFMLPLFISKINMLQFLLILLFLRLGVRIQNFFNSCAIKTQQKNYQTFELSFFL